VTCAPTHRACGPAAQARAALALAVVIAGLGLGGCSAPKPAKMSSTPTTSHESRNGI